MRFTEKIGLVLTALLLGLGIYTTLRWSLRNHRYRDLQNEIRSIPWDVL